MLSRAAGNVAPNLVGYYPSPVRQHQLRYEIYAAAWLESENRIAAQVYDDQLPSLEPGERAAFSPTADPERQLTVELAPGAAQRWDRSTSLVRFDVRPAGQLPAGTIGWVKFTRRPRGMQVIPVAAVLEDPDGPYVLVYARASGKVTRRAIEVGKDHDRARRGAVGPRPARARRVGECLLWDAERRLQDAGGESRDWRGGGGEPRP